MTNSDKPTDSLANDLKQDLLRRYGPMIGQDDLRQALGYTSPSGFRQALSRGVIPVPVFAIPHRKGKYALTNDVASWLAELRRQAKPSTAAISDRASGQLRCRPEVPMSADRIERTKKEPTMSE